MSRRVLAAKDGSRLPLLEVAALGLIEQLNERCSVEVAVENVVAGVLVPRFVRARPAVGDVEEVMMLAQVIEAERMSSSSISWS
jgi:hypothetical protein